MESDEYDLGTYARKTNNIYNAVYWDLLNDFSDKTRKQ